MGAASNTIVVYDNFDYLQRVQHQTLGDTGTFYSRTTGKLVFGVSIPNGGLRQSMLRADIPIKFSDIAEAPGNLQDEIQKQISTALIYKAIVEAYPGLDILLSKNPRFKHPRMPSINVIPAARTSRFNLGPIMTGEASISETYKVLDDIFLHQMNLQRTDKAFEERLFLIYGDQKTAKLIRSCQGERTESISAYDSLRWALPIPALWHLKLNYLYMVIRYHYGGKQSAQEYSTLYTHMNHLGRRNIPAERAPFHHMEELILHSFDARIIALLHTQIKESCNTKSPIDIKRYLKSLSPQRLLAVVEDIRTAVFGQEVSRAANHASQPAEPRQKGHLKQAGSAASSQTLSKPADAEFLTHVRFLQLVETYKVLKHAIKLADIGLLSRVLPRICIYFAGGRNKNYLPEMLRFFQLTSTDACSPELQQAILVNSLVNIRGEQDSHYPIDLDNELLNGELKQLMHTRGNSTFNLDSLFRWSIHMTNYTGPLRAKFEITFGERMSTRHTVKSPAADIQSLANAIAEGSIIRRQARRAKMEAPPLLQLGIERLNQSALNEFNSRLGGDLSAVFDELDLHDDDNELDGFVLPADFAQTQLQPAYELLDE